MDSRVRERLSLGRKVLDMLRRQDFRSEYSEASLDGEHAFIPALQDDTVGYVFDRVREVAGTAYVVTRVANHIEVAMMVTESSPVAWHAAVVNDSECPIHRSTEVGMLFAYLRQQHGRQVVCREVSPALTMELVESGSDLSQAGLSPC